MHETNTRFLGSTYVVTGAGQGLGRDIAVTLATEGASVIVSDINIEAARAVSAQIADNSGQSCAIELDVTSNASCDALAAAIAENFGAVDGLVNSAAVFSSLLMKPMWEVTEQEWDHVMAVNLRGPWQVTKSLMHALRASSKASIVNVTSDAVWMGRGGYLHYIASKSGVYGMTHSMSHELGEFGIRVNSVSPGPIYTEVDRASVTAAQRQHIRQNQSLGRDAGPADVTGPVLFLLSPDSGWMTGQTLHLNGGLLHI